MIVTASNQERFKTDTNLQNAVGFLVLDDFNAFKKAHQATLYPLAALVKLEKKAIKKNAQVPPGSQVITMKENELGDQVLLDLRRNLFKKKKDPYFQTMEVEKEGDKPITEWLAKQWLKKYDGRKKNLKETLKTTTKTRNKTQEKLFENLRKIGTPDNIMDRAVELLETRVKALKKNMKPTAKQKRLARKATF